MSRIGRKPVAIPSGVKVELIEGVIKAKGAKGELSVRIPEEITVKIENANITFERDGEEKNKKALHGLTRALVANVIQGVSQGFTRSLDIVGVGYKAELVGGESLKMSLGYSNPIDFALPIGVRATVEDKGTKLVLAGADKALVGQTAANIKGLRLPDSYKGKGVRFTGEKLKLKAGKAGSKK
ncbi:MAG: 50S ribosomal protein L6 [Deltaproteobacteria bacterium]